MFNLLATLLLLSRCSVSVTWSPWSCRTAAKRNHVHYGQISTSSRGTSVSVRCRLHQVGWIIPICILSLHLLHLYTYCPIIACQLLISLSSCFFVWPFWAPIFLFKLSPDNQRVIWLCTVNYKQSCTRDHSPPSSVTYTALISRNDFDIYGRGRCF